MYGVHSPINSEMSDIYNLDEAVVNRKWLYSFFAYYGFALVVSFLPVILFVEPFAWYDMRLLLYPVLHYYFYRKASIYWFMFFTSIALSLGITHGVLMELLAILRMKSFIGLFLWWVHVGLFSYFIYNCFQLLKINIQNNLTAYNSVVRSLWVVSLLVCYSFSLLQDVYRLPHGLNESLPEVLGMFVGTSLIVCLWYYLAIQRKGTVALWVILFFFPKSFIPWGDISSILNRLSWFGFFIYFCISTYRLYKVNRAERKEVVQGDRDSVDQTSI